MDKNKAVIEYLVTCPSIVESPLFFNYGEAFDGNSQFNTIATDKRTNVHFIDGSVKKVFTFTLIWYKQIAHRAIIEDEEDENMETVLDIQSVVDWVETQNDNRNFPDFGKNCEIDSIQALTDQPNLNSVDRSSTPALAKYSISIRIEYIDTSKRIWNVEGD